MYAGGAAHPLREPSIKVLALVDRDPVRFVTSAEVFQELLHVYRRRGLWPQAQATFQGFLELMAGRIEPVGASDVAVAASLAHRYPRLETRDLLHVGVMRRLGITRIVSRDGAFEGVEGIQRLDPAGVDSWSW